VGRFDLILSPLCRPVWLSPQVDSLPYQWLLVKNKTIMGPKSTEEQKVLLVAPQAGVYQCVLSVSSWPASSSSSSGAAVEPDAHARPDVFAKRVVLVAVAENPAIEVRPAQPTRAGLEMSFICSVPSIV